MPTGPSLFGEGLLDCQRSRGRTGTNKKNQPGNPSSSELDVILTVIFHATCDFFLYPKQLQIRLQIQSLQKLTMIFIS